MLLTLLRKETGEREQQQPSKSPAREAGTLEVTNYHYNIGLSLGRAFIRDESLLLEAGQRHRGSLQRMPPLFAVGLIGQ